jgi:hypothetical protein
LLASVCLVATTVRILNERNASFTDSVPSAQSLRPLAAAVVVGAHSCVEGLEAFSFVD